MASGVIFAELHMRSGEHQDGSDLVGVATSPVLSLFKRQRGQLFTVVEPSLPGCEDFCHRLIQVVQDEYFKGPSRSVITSLRQAIAAANERLRAENSRATPDRQLRVGLSCAAVRDGDVYVAQVAPANAFILHEGAVKRVFSTYSVVAETSANGTDRASDSLGSLLDPHVNFSYSELEGSDMVVLATGAYWKMIPDRYILDAARHVDPEMAAQELYGCYTAHIRRPTTSILVIRASGSLGGARPAEARPSGPAARQEERAVEEAPLPRDRPRPGGSSGRDDGRQPAPGRTARERPAWQPEPLPMEKGVGNPLAALVGRMKGVAGRKEKPPLYPPGPKLEPVGKSSVRLRPNLSRNWSDRGGPSWASKLLVALVVVAALTLVGYLGMNLWTSWQLGDPTALTKDAQEKRALASSGESPAAARALLQQSHDLLLRAQKARDDEPTRSLAASVQADLDSMDRTVRVAQAKTVVDYSSLVEEKGEVSQLVVESNNLYVLDEGLDRVYKYLLTSDGRGVEEAGQHPVLVRRGDKQDGAVLGDLLSLFWMPAGQLRSSPALFSLEGGRSLVAYDPKVGLSRIEVSESAKWGTVQAASGFAGGLYLLDTKLKQLLYYPPTKNGYESQPYMILDSKSRVDLGKALDMALDGNLYVLEGDGSVKRFSREGRPMEFGGEVPDGPAKGARAIFASANTRSLYLLDAQGERVLQFSQDGKLQRQFKAGGKDVSFQNLRDFHVDEVGRKMYLLAQKSLIVFDMPPMQQ